MWKFITDKFDALVQFLSDYFDYVMSFFLSFYNGFEQILIIFHNYFTYFNNQMTSYLDLFYSTWINPSVPIIPDFFVNSMRFLNGLFPLTELFSYIQTLIILWLVALLIKLVLRLITLGQA